MKRLINQYLPVEIDYPIENVQRIEFRFSQYGKAVRDVEYPSDDVLYSDGMFLVRFTANDTAGFDDSFVVMDTRITPVEGFVQPETSIAKFVMHETLFEPETEA